jgi:small ligand-binding sensory domain FIST
MSRFLAAHAEHTDWKEAARLCLNQLGTIPAACNLGFLYFTDRLAAHAPAILDFFKYHTGTEAWIGSVGVGIAATGTEYYDRPAIAVMLGTFSKNSFRVFSSLREAASELPATEGDWLSRHQPALAIVHGDAHNPYTPAIVDELPQAVPGCFLVGGITSSRGPQVQLANNVTNGGVSGALFSSQVPVVTALTQGVAPVGPKFEITEARGNVVIRINNRPALEVFNETINATHPVLPATPASYLFVALPVRGSDTGDYLVRNIIGIDPEQQAIAIGEYLRTGDMLQFCRRDLNTAQDDLRRMLQDLKRRAGGTPKGGVYYSCLGRGQHLFGDNSEELRAIQQELGDFPLVGFFANGEISHHRLYGYTGVLTLFL